MTDSPPSGNFASALWSVTSRHASAPFLIEPGATTAKASKIWSYGQIDDLAARYAEVLKAHGAEPGHRVLVQVHKSAEAVALYLACLRAGTVHVPLNPAFTPAELEHFLNDAQPSVAVLDPSSAAAQTAASRPTMGRRPRILTLGPEGEGTLVQQADALNVRAVQADQAVQTDQADRTDRAGRAGSADRTDHADRAGWTGSADRTDHADRAGWGGSANRTDQADPAGSDGWGGSAAIVERRDDDLAVLLYTSGTTGRPKGAALSNANLRHNAVALHDIWRFSRSDHLLHCLPIFHTHGLFVALHCAMLSAIPVTFLARFDTEQVLDSLQDATVMMGVPTHYGRLLGSPRLTTGLAFGIRLFTCGSAPLRDSVFDEFSERTGHRICERYGMSETGIITSNPYDGERLAGTVGHPLPEVELRVVDLIHDEATDDQATDDQAAPVEPGVIGAVEVRGPHVFSGYWDRSDCAAGNALSDDGWFTTGDLGSLDESGRLRLHGRTGDLIISGGENIYPKEIEIVLDQVIGIRESAVIGLPDEDLGEAVTAVVVVDHERFALDDCRTELSRRLSRHKHPKQILIVPTLPRNAMGKVQRNVLRTRYEQREQHPGPDGQL